MNTGIFPVYVHKYLANALEHNLYNQFFIPVVPGF